jgi:hypothetical protein
VCRASLRREFPRREIVLRRHPEGIGDAVEKSEQRGHVHRFSDLLFLPARITKLLNIIWRCPVSGLGDQLYIVQQGALRRRKARFLDPALDDCLYALIRGSLNPQEVSVAVQSIRAAVQVRNVTGDHFLVAPREVPLGKMHGV